MHFHLLTTDIACKEPAKLLADHPLHQSLIRKWHSGIVGLFMKQNMLLCNIKIPCEVAEAVIAEADWEPVRQGVLVCWHVKCCALLRAASQQYPVLPIKRTSEMGRDDK
jgi:hypothetical protein